MKAKDARRGVTEQREDVPSKKNKSGLGRYVLQQRLDPDSSLARIVKKNVWAQCRDLSWANFDEASRVGRIFAREKWMLSVSAAGFGDGWCNFFEWRAVCKHRWQRR